MIEAEGLSKYYARLPAVDEVSFRIAKGEVVGLLGPNGAGKTTTMRMLTTFLSPSSGTAKIAGYDICTQAEAVRAQIGYLPETPALYPELTPKEFLTFIAKVKGVPRKALKERVDQAIEQCLLTEVTSKVCGQLSRGYRQRVGLAAAIVHRPKVIILDEPTSGLDPAQIIDIRQLIRGFAQEHTVLLSTHILPEVAETCSRVLIIARGKIVVEGSLKELTKERTLEECFLQAVAGYPQEVAAQLEEDSHVQG